MNFMHRSSQSSEENEIGESDAGQQVPSALQALLISPNTLLEGPQQSDRTSLLMDMANSLALSSMPCRGNCLGVGSTCHCVAVALVLPRRQEETPSFPLLVAPAAPEEASNDFEAQMRALEPKQRPSWDADALRRIQVYHVASLWDLMEYLLSLQSKPPNEQPYHGILVDQVDSFARIPFCGTTEDGDQSNTSPRSELSTQELMSLTQILALLVDTGSVLRKSSKALSVVASMETGLSSPVKRLLSNWFPKTIQLHPGEAWKIPPLQDGDMVESWGIIRCVNGTDGKSSSNNQSPPNVAVDYAMLRSEDGSSHIIWRKQS